ncbi:signal transducer ampG1 [Trichormus variabilis ATCC 29413]|uniref:Signal transducer ampG1 n=2 Tax=Anabaena variabilis TaxID=264691 RepID=Q3MDB3_TRIV2|nr:MULTISPECIES: AmpG family muropeptide MFS transporter [Nostocaceae]ABA21023.1 signal transducer ampG1 [Trichormus variabilis ATCC 29413]MBC1214173.1 AmpG family muropeptide MFS transporter [Trichormus variabilis ARAD]MBC1256028.1 AmpG family muropeptide MFS transporter [Trichormus variabilis V5]MBC1269231.1 AmpG family muropeptide MFS transporter [Trichormus variabilis FSR]MBC1300654.1 AmpG family muropeptide MFS transporter [Trichormus variabilis N2B]
MREVQALRQAFQSRKMGALLLLGFASGLPLFLTSRTLQLWMQDAKVDLGKITLFGLLALPYSLKFLWSPLLDRFVPPLLGARRGWLICTQIGLTLAIAALALQQPSQSDQVLQILAINCLIITFLSATQDIAGDAYRTDILNPLEAEPGASVWVLGYRIALFITSSLAIVLADYIPWNGVYLLMAVFMAGSILTTLWSPPEPEIRNAAEKYAPISVKDVIFIVLITVLVAGLIGGVFVGYIALPVFYWLLASLIVAWIVSSLLLPIELLGEVTEDSPPQNLQAAIFLPFKEFFHRFGLTQASVILIFIILYKLGDSLVGITANLFLREIAFTKTEIGAIQAGIGFIATTIGVLAGGVIMTKIHLNRSLWIFGILQLLSNLGYYALAIAGKNYSLLVLAVNIENFSAGLVTVATVAFLMNLCNHRFTTTQFALFSSLMAISRDVLSAPAGDLAKATGWPAFFLLTLAAALPGLLLLPVVAPWNPKPVAINRPGLDDEDLWETK